MPSKVYPEGAAVKRYADVSPDGIYRYSLGRVWGSDGLTLPFIMLNPSTADATEDDPTIRKCVGFARRLGYTGIAVVNLYAYRATKPERLREADRTWGIDIVGPGNDDVLSMVLSHGMSINIPVVAAWGAQPGIDARVREVLALPGAQSLHALGLTAKGVPRHPLMLGYEGAALTPLVPR